MSILKAISLGSLQNFNHWLQEMESEGVTYLSDARKRAAVEEYARHKELAGGYRKRKIVVTSSVVQCPFCGKTARYLPVNDRPSTQVDGDYQSMLLCQKCGYEEYFIESVSYRQRGQK